MMTINDVKDDPILQVSSQEPSMSSKYRLQEQRVLDTLLITYILCEPWHCTLVNLKKEKLKK
jgi:hypothetical protein